MTDKLHCPFCSAELRKPDVYWGEEPPELHCANPACFEKYGDAKKEIWQAFIDSKAAQDALKWVNEYLDDLLDNRENEDVPISAEFLKNEIALITKQEN